MVFNANAMKRLLNRADTTGSKDGYKVKEPSADIKDCAGGEKGPLLTRLKLAVGVLTGETDVVTW